jgi:hypothetical protein
MRRRRRPRSADDDHAAGGDTQARSVASFGLAQINQAKRKATCRFASREPGSTFSCKLCAGLPLAERRQRARAPRIGRNR